LSLLLLAQFLGHVFAVLTGGSWGFDLAAFFEGGDAFDFDFEVT
jgi:hypothetical protein